MSELSIVQDNRFYLQQAKELICHISPDQLIHANPPLYTSGVGPHLRHCFDHISLLLGGLDTGKVDYDDRSREPERESSVDAICAWIDELDEQLSGLSEMQLASDLKIKMDTGGTTQQPWSNSSVYRELQFQISHTVHHFALIAMILRDQGMPVPENFGVAPSTIHHEELTACAQ